MDQLIGPSESDEEILSESLSDVSEVQLITVDDYINEFKDKFDFYDFLLTFDNDEIYELNEIYLLKKLIKDKSYRDQDGKIKIPTVMGNLIPYDNFKFIGLENDSLKTTFDLSDIDFILPNRKKTTMQIILQDIYKRM